MKNIMIAIAVLVLILGAILIFRNRSPEPVEPVEVTTEEPGTPTPPTETPVEPDPETPVETTATDAPSDPTPTENPVAAAPVEKEEPVETEEEADELLREKLEPRDPVLKELVSRDNLLLKSVTATDLIARGKNPISQFGYLKPKGRLLVEERDGRLYLSERNYQRYDRFIRALESVDGAEMGRMYYRMSHLARKVYEPLGSEETDWQKVLGKTLDLMINFEVPGGEIELAGRGGIYIYVDDRLESLPPSQKALIRMGPENATRLQRKLRELKRYID